MLSDAGRHAGCCSPAVSEKQVRSRRRCCTVPRLPDLPLHCSLLQCLPFRNGAPPFKRICRSKKYQSPMLTIEAHWKGMPEVFGSPYICAIGDTVTGGAHTTGGLQLMRGCCSAAAQLMHGCCCCWSASPARLLMPAHTSPSPPPPADRREGHTRFVRIPGLHKRAGR